MSWDSPDRRSLEIPQERVDRVIGTVLARLDATPQAMAAPGPWARLMEWLAPLVPVTRFAMPMAAAIVLGIMVGQHLEAADQAAHLGELLTSTSVYALDF